MKEILLFGGTTEGRIVSECLTRASISHTICVATEYGEILLEDALQVTIRRGRMEQSDIRELIAEGNFAAVVDATHPYATVVTENIKSAINGFSIPYFRIQRKAEKEQFGKNITYFESQKTCAKALEEIKGNILLTTGSKELAEYCQSEELRNRLYVRVLPSVESITCCMKQGIYGKQILALQGPFSKEFNEAVIHHYKIACIVTKESGISGGYLEKTEAAESAGIPIYVIGRPTKEDGISVAEVCAQLQILCKKKVLQNPEMKIILVGVGMGSVENLTKEAAEAIAGADILLGAERMIQTYRARIEKKPYYSAEQIIPYLKEIANKRQLGEATKIVILFSGDSGFYSGCQSLHRKIEEEIKKGEVKATVRILPGISCVAYLAAALGESYQDAVIKSIHGKTSWRADILDTVRNHAKTFLLVSGAEDVRALGQFLMEDGCFDCMVTAGYCLSYPEEKRRRMTPKECCDVQEEGLYTCLIQNPCACSRRLTHGITDTEFTRNKVPMTKEEIREISICKLKLQENALVYDIGSGTGSIAIEIASLSPKIQVFAIERKPEAVQLMKQNKETFQTHNMTIIEGEAPEELRHLPKATHAFLGGSGGNLKSILSELNRINPQMRIVITAVSMETICEINESLPQYRTAQEEMIQVQVSRSKQAGNYHMMQAENPIWICSFTFAGSIAVAACLEG